MKRKHLLIILIPLLIILFNFKILMFNEDFYDEEVNKNLLNYFQNKEELKFNYTNEEIIHLKDVKSLVQKLNITILLLSLITILILFFNKGLIYKELIISGAITLLILIILYFINFNYLFTLFHKILFTNNYWLLPKESLLIQTYPLEFFISFTKRLSLNIIFSSLVVIALGIIQNVHSRHKSSNS